MLTIPKGSVQSSDPSKQDTLVSGTNIKTINGAPILGPGDIVVTAGTGDKIVSNYVGTLVTSVGLSRYYPRTPITIKSVYFSVGNAPTSGQILIDVRKSGVSIFSVKPTLSIGENLSSIVDVNVPLLATDWLTTDISVTGAGGQHATIVINYI